MKTIKEPLNAEELKFAKLRFDEAVINDIGLNAQLSIYEKELELGIPNRKKSEEIENIKENIKKNKMNKDFYEKQIREGKEIVVKDEDVVGEPEEVVEAEEVTGVTE
jgi:hypothetical protein